MRRMTRSRGKSLPRAVWRSRSFAGPPAAASARLAARSATTARMAAALALNSSEAVEMRDLILGIVADVLNPCHRGPYARDPACGLFHTLESCSERRDAF